MRAFVVSDDASLSYQIRDVLLRLGHECPAAHVVSLDQAPVYFSAGSAAPAGKQTAAEPELLFVALLPDAERALTVIRDLRRSANKRLFAVGSTGEPKLVLRAIREGAHEFLDQAELREELSAALERMKAESTSTAPGGRIVAVLGAGGGNGSTTLATGMATVLAQTAGGCILLDLKTEAGDLAPLLDLKPTYTTADLCQNASRLDRGLLESALAAHGSGVRLLAAPARVSDAPLVTADGIRRVLSLAMGLSPWIVADVGHPFRPEQLQTLRQADEIVLVLCLAFISLRNSRRILEYLGEAGGIPPERVRLVVNRHRQAGEVPAAEAESALGRKLVHYIADDPKTVNRASNQGIPVVQYYPTARVSRQISELAAALVQSREKS